MIRKLKSGQYRLLSLNKDEKTGHRQDLGTFDTLQAARRHEREIHYFKLRGSTGSFVANRGSGHRGPAQPILKESNT